MLKTISRSTMVVALSLAIIMVVALGEFFSPHTIKTTDIVSHKEHENYSACVKTNLIMNIKSSNRETKFKLDNLIEPIEPLKSVELAKEYTYLNNVATFDLRQKSNINLKKLKEYLNNYSGLRDFQLAETLIKIESEYDINALFLLAIIRIESGNGKSDLAIHNNNLGSIISATSYTSFTSKSECVWYMAELLANKYLNENGEWYGGGYTVRDVNKYYCETASWYKSIEYMMEEIEWGLFND